MMTRSWPAAAGILALSACGIQPTSSLDAGPGARADWETTIVYYLVDDQPYPAVRLEASPAGPPELAALLAAGPTAQEREAGLDTEVPSSLRLTVDAGRLVVDGLGTLTELALDQIACTFERNESVNAAGTTLHSPDGTVVHDMDCPVGRTFH